MKLLKNDHIYLKPIKTDVNELLIRKQLFGPQIVMLP